MGFLGAVDQDSFVRSFVTVLFGWFAFCDLFAFCTFRSPGLSCAHAGFAVGSVLLVSVYGFAGFGSRSRFFAVLQTRFATVPLPRFRCRHRRCSLVGCTAAVYAATWLGISFSLPMARFCRAAGLLFYWDGLCTTLATCWAV
jgi:hypothetical protein